MSMIFRSKPSPALLIAVVALIAALAGTAVGGVAVTSLTGKEKKQVRRISKQLVNQRLKANVSGSHVNLADHALSADSANTAVNADSAAKSDQAGNADRLAGLPASEYQKTGPSQFKPVDSFQNGWIRFSASFSEPGYWIDGDGIVNLQGRLKGGTDTLAFQLPPEARPATSRGYVIRCFGGPGTGALEVEPSGSVSIFNQSGSNCATYAFIDGLTFRPDK